MSSKKRVLPPASARTLSIWFSNAERWGDQDDRAAAFAQRRDRVNEGGFAIAVQMSVRLVQHNQRRFAIHGAGQRHALALAGGSAACRHC